MLRRGIVVKALVIVSLLGVSVAQNADIGAPYIQYYAASLGGFVIERADGSDSRLFAEDDIYNPYQSLQKFSVSDPGWSPSGEWFAWKGSAQRVDGSGRFDAVETYAPQFSRVMNMEWSPGMRDVLLIVGAKNPVDCQCGDEITLILRDMNTGESIATWGVTSDQSMALRNLRPAVWSSEGGGQVSVSILIVETLDRIESVKVSLGLDGSTSQESLPNCCHQGGGSPDVIRYGTPHESPSGRYHIVIDYYTHLLDRTTGIVHKLPAYSSSRIPTQYLNFNRAETWMLVSQSSFITGDYEGPDLLGVMNMSGTYWRELSVCRFGCGSWLPDQVDVTRLPSGSPESVLLAPTSTTFYKRQIDNWHYPNYEIDCDDLRPDGRQASPVKGTGRTYHLDYRHPCTLSSGSVREVIAAVSPDGRLLALSENSGRDVSIWSTHAGDLLTRLNTFGYGLSFSADGHALYTVTSRAIHTWDVDEIWRRYSYRAGLD